MVARVPSSPLNSVCERMATTTCSSAAPDEVTHRIRRPAGRGSGRFRTHRRADRSAGLTFMRKSEYSSTETTNSQTPSDPTKTFSIRYSPSRSVTATTRLLSSQILASTRARPEVPLNMRPDRDNPSGILKSSASAGNSTRRRIDPIAPTGVTTTETRPTGAPSMTNLPASSVMVSELHESRSLVLSDTGRLQEHSSTRAPSNGPPSTSATRPSTRALPDLTINSASSRIRVSSANHVATPESRRYRCRCPPSYHRSVNFPLPSVRATSLTYGRARSERSFATCFGNHDEINSTTAPSTPRPLSPTIRPCNVCSGWSIGVFQSISSSAPMSCDCAASSLTLGPFSDACAPECRRIGRRPLGVLGSETSN
jgi:hypothetical protein